MLWWSSPKNETIPWVDISWICLTVDELLENRIYDKTLKVGGQELRLLLIIPVFSVRFVSALNQFLARQMLESRVLCHRFTGSSKQVSSKLS